MINKATRSIYIGNLPYSVTRDQLREAFVNFGRVINSEVALDEQGNSKGFGIVRFESKWNALSAIEAMD